MANDMVLELSNVSIGRDDSQQKAGISDASFSVARGDLAFILVENEVDWTPLSDLAEGLIDPDNGAVKFMGHNWKEMPATVKEDMRGKIGRVFERDGWVSNLTVSENVELAERHHTARPDADIREEVANLYSLVGLPLVFEQRPDIVAKSLLRRAEWVRAFLGNRRLLLLEQPERDVPADSLPSLIELISRAREMQKAVIWMTHDRHIWSNRSFINGSRFRVKNETISQAEEVQ